MRGIFINVNNDNPYSGYMVESIIDGIEVLYTEGTMRAEEYVNSYDFNTLLEMDSDLYRGLINLDDGVKIGLYRNYYNMIDAIKSAHSSGINRIYDLHRDDFIHLELDDLLEDCCRQLL